MCPAMRGQLFVISLVAAASLCTACLGQERALPGVADTGPTPPAPGWPVAATTTTSSASGGARATGSTTTSTSSTTSSTTSVPPPRTVHYPTTPVTPLPRGSIQVFSRIDTADPVVFLTLDDGIVRDPRIIPLLAEHGATATLFLNSGPLNLDPEYFQQFIAAGGSVNSHTFQHPNLPQLDLTTQRQQICGMADQIEATYGSAGHFFRPPYGEFDDNTLIAARGCGLRAVLLWRVSLNNGGYQTWGGRPIAAGDIILGHFRDDLYENLVVLFAELDRLGLTVASLEDYLPAA